MGTNRAERKLDRIINAVREAQYTLAAEGAAVAQAAVIQGVNRNIYDTEPGKYLRTGATLRLTRVAPSGRPGFFNIISGHGAFGVEFGEGVRWEWRQIRVNWVKGTVTGLPGMTNAQQGTAYIGRTGKHWGIPGPFVAPAAVHANWHMRNRLAQIIKELGS